MTITDIETIDSIRIMPHRLECVRPIVRAEFRDQTKAKADDAVSRTPWAVT